MCGLPVRNIDADLHQLQREWKLDVVLVTSQEGGINVRAALGGNFHEIGLQLCTLDLILKSWNDPQIQPRAFLDRHLTPPV